MTKLIHSILPEHKQPIIFIHPDVSITQCVELMVQHNIGALVVTDDENILSVITERDIVRNLVAKNRSPETTKVNEIACANVNVLSPSDSVEQAMHLMTYTKRRYVLIKEDETLIAIISIGDLLFNLLEHKEQKIDELKKYIQTY